MCVGQCSEYWDADAAKEIALAIFPRSSFEETPEEYRFSWVS